tara:strand:+ start:325 stop:501 length:177 start_codon:yes stop_codon:yes gene_type:complete
MCNLKQKDMEFTKEIITWIKDGNVVKVSKNRYIEQTTQWRKLFTKTELINFFIREFKN